MKISLRTTYACAYLTVESGDTRIEEDVMSIGQKIDTAIGDDLLEISREINSINGGSDIDFIMDFIDKNLTGAEVDYLLSEIKERFLS